MENQFSAVAKVILNLRDLNCHLFSFKSDVQQLFQYHSRASSNELGGHVAEEQTAAMGAFAAPAAQTLPTRGEEGDQENFAMTAADNAMTLVSLFGSFSDPSDFLSHEDEAAVLVFPEGHLEFLRYTYSYR
uniref:Uncharacterized protein n=1 Tax=Knipowitschia caucasica TaxID=637954 RepID=A0AAV2K5T9_KNICA